jgi:hypothetical protein
MKIILTNLQEAADMHSPDCCTLSGDCDVDCGGLDCCDNMKFIKKQIKGVVEFICFDIEPKNEKARKCMINGYMSYLED